MSQEEFDYSNPEKFEQRLNELEEQKIDLIKKIADVYSEMARLRGLQEKAKKLDNTHKPDCTCMDCEQK